MVLSYYLSVPLYTVAWHILKMFRKRRTVVLYCEDAFDYTLFRNVGKYLKKIPVVAKNHKVARLLKARGITCTIMPVFPDAVIMFRNMAWKFPCKKIVKFGFEHGAYNFKKFSKPSYYNMFDVFFMTSSHDVERVRKRGVKTAEAIGFPKIDSAFDGSISEKRLSELSESLHLDPGKKTLLFSATWDGSGMSAVHVWYDRLNAIADEYNILITLHPWVSETYRETLAGNTSVHCINDDELLSYIMLSDVCIGDTSSIIAEFCLLDKPMVTFKIPPTNRTMTDVIEVIETVSIRIGSFEELKDAVERCLTNKVTMSEQRREATYRFFDKPDGCAGKRAADRICSFIPELVP